MARRRPTAEICSTVVASYPLAVNRSIAAWMRASPVALTTSTPLVHGQHPAKVAVPEASATTSPCRVRNRTAVAVAPYLGAQFGVEHHRFGEPATDRCQCLRIAAADDVDQRPRGEAEGAQPVQEDVVEAELAGRRGIDVQWVAITAETINRGLLGPDHVVRTPRRAHRAGPSLGRRAPRSAESAAAQHHCLRTKRLNRAPSASAPTDSHLDGGVLALVPDRRSPRP